MTRLEFFQRLEQGLSRLPQEEYYAALNYYTEYFNDAGPEEEARVLAELGDPDTIAQQIVAESMVRDIVARPETPHHAEEGTPPPRPKKGLGAVWTVILAVFAAPIALPIAIAIAVAALALVIAAAAVVLAFFTAALALVVAGIASFFLGCAALLVHLPTGLFGIGAGIAITGTGLLLALPTIWLAKTLFTAIARWLGRRVFEKKEATS